MKKVILITLGSLLLIDAYVTYSMNYKQTENTNNTITTPQTKKLHDPKTSLIVSGNDEGQDFLIKTPSLYNSTHKSSQGGCNNCIEVKVFF